MKHGTRISVLLPDLHGGGAERVGINLANEFVRRGFTVDMVLMSTEGVLFQNLDARVDVVDLQARRMRNLLLPLAGYLRRVRPAALIANMWPLTIIAPKAKRLAFVSTRVVGVEHTTWSASVRSRDKWFLRLHSIGTRFGYRLLDAMVAVSSGAADDVAKLARLPRDRIGVIYNPIVGIKSQIPVRAGILAPAAWSNGMHQKILAVGTLKAIKDYPTLLHAFAGLRKRSDAKLLLLGEGEQRLELEHLVQELGLEVDVFMPGFVDDTKPYFAQADLHVLSSTGEGFGNVIVEALEQGTPVVSTDCPSGPREVLEGGKYGTLVPVGDVDALAKAMEDALSREHDHDALKRRAQDFTVDKAADAYLDLLIPDWRKARASGARDAATP